MYRKWLLIFVLLLNQALINSVLADSHISATERGLFDAPHIHLDDKGADKPGQDSSAPDAQKHDSAGHVHIPCDLCNAALPAVQYLALAEFKSSEPVPVYLSLTYKPVVPPPTA